MSSLSARCTTFGVVFLLLFCFTASAQAQLTTNPVDYFIKSYTLFGGSKLVFTGGTQIEHQANISKDYNQAERLGFSLHGTSTEFGIGKMYFIRENGTRWYEYDLYPHDGPVVTPEYEWEHEGQYEVDFYTTQPGSYFETDQYLTSLTFSVQLTGGPLPKCNVSVSPQTIVSGGDEVTLSWSTTNATTLTIDQGVGEVSSLSGSVVLTPLETTTYTGTVVGPGGEGNCSTTVTVETSAALHERAAALARQLVDTPDGYLWGGKGWDYDLGEFTTPVRILNGYTYYNPDAAQKQTGIGLDCSGLIAWAFNRSYDAALGFTKNFVQYVNADGMFRDAQSDSVAEADLRPGDTLSFDWDNNGRIDHVAMYVGESGGYDVVNAASPQNGIESQVSEFYISVGNFSGYRRIHQAGTEMSVTTGSPVDLIVTDPYVNIIDASTIVNSDEEYIREVPGELYYIELEQGHDGRPKDQVLIPKVQEGDYKVKVVPEAGADPAATYSLSVEIDGVETVVVDNELVADIDSAGYLVTVADGELKAVASTIITLLTELSSDIGQNTAIPEKNKTGLQKTITSAIDWFNKGRLDQVKRKLKKVSNDFERHSVEHLSSEEQEAIRTIINNLNNELAV